MAAHDCGFPDCDRQIESRGYCSSHAKQLRAGLPLRPLRHRRRQSELSERCGFDGCTKPRRHNNLCSGHASQLARGRPLTPLLRQGQPCSFAGCHRPHTARGLCIAHYDQARRGRTLSALPPASTRERGSWRTSSQGYRIRTVSGVIEYEHRVVMEHLLGRPLDHAENVHHLNGDRADNRPENLELWSRSQPPGQRVEDKVQWAREILDLYSDLYPANPARS